MSTRRLVALTLAVLAAPAVAAAAEDADLIVRNAKVVTVDRGFSIAQALAVRDGRLIVVGTDDAALATKGPATRVVDLRGKTVLPGLIDSHTHSTDACLTEFDHPVPEMRTIADVLDHIRKRAEDVGEGNWVVVRQVFITRLAERRYPTRAELDRVAPKNPVLFGTGPDASLNTLALKLSGIDRDFRPEGPGKVERDPQTGEPTGILRNLTRYVKAEDNGRKPSDAERDDHLAELLRDYNAVGITAILDRNASEGAVNQYTRMRDAKRLTTRVAISRGVESSGPLDDIRRKIAAVAEHPLRRPDPMLRIIGIKMFLDGGMLTGSAFMREPWGVSKTYAIDDPTYRGVLFIPPERLEPIVRATVAAGLQFTAHSVGDGAVDNLLDAYEAVNKEMPIAATRPCLTHANFMTREAIARAARLGVAADIQPAWLYLDAPTLLSQFGNERMAEFQPLKTLFASGVTVGGGSDHMQKIGPRRSINPYDPFLAMWVAVTRNSRGDIGPLHPEEALTREQAIRMYTSQNARILFLEDQIGSLEPGKRADFVVLDRDILTCPADEIRDTRPVATYLDGRPVHEVR